MSLELTARCNLRCAHCYLEPRRVAEMSTRQWLVLLRQMASAGVLKLSISGGEVFLRKDVFQILQAVREHRFAAGLITNGTLVSRSVAQRLSELSLVRVSVSLHADRAREHELVTGVPGSFKRALRGIEHLLQCGVRVSVQTNIMRQNARRLLQWKRLVTGMGAEFRLAWYLQTSESGSTRPLESLPDLAGLRAALGGPDVFEALGLTGLARRDAQRRSSRPCSAGISTCHIDAHGYLYPCGTWPRSWGRVTDAGFLDQWRNNPDCQWMRHEARRHRACVGCALNGLCSHCYAESLLATGDLLGVARARCSTAARFSLFAGGPNARSDPRGPAGG